MKMRSVVLCVATLASPAALAGVSGNVGAVSDYMFRGITQTAGPAVQGGIDWSSDAGFYAGTWVSNIGFAGAIGGTEQDFYAGYGFAAGPVAMDVGAIYYWYPEEGELDEDYSTLEFVVSAAMGPVTLSYNHGSKTNFFLGDGEAESAGYLKLAGSFPISESLTFDASIGQYSGDEIERVLVSEDSYMDYAVGLSKSLDGGMTATFQYVMTDISAETDAGFDDAPKFVLGLNKSFDF